MDAAQFVLENAEDATDQRLLFLCRASGQTEEQFRARPVVFHFDQPQRGNDVGQRGRHFIRDTMEQDLLFLDFGIQSLMCDDRFARPLQD